MANISAGDSTKAFQIQKWLGLNESPDGDTGLKMGEAAKMRNFRITRENHLQVRPGYAPMATLMNGKPVRGLWCGYVGGVQRLLASCGGILWELTRVEDPPVEGGGGAGDHTPLVYFNKKHCGTIDDGEVSFFGFAKKVYLLTGSQYYCWDGTEDVSVVEGYIPTVATATVPSGGGTILEESNLLTGKKRQEFSPDGEAKVFHIIETDIDEIIQVEGTAATWTVDKKAGTVNFATPPAKGTNTLFITWRKGDGTRDEVVKMRFSELYNGASDSRVFLYGNGSNQTIYSGIDRLSMPTAEYFPAMNTMAVDRANTPITAMIRHYDRLLVYKTDSTYAAQYSTLTLADGRVAPAFYASPLNREIGCGAAGQVRLVENDPRTIFGRGVYQWSLTVGSSRDERNAKRISDRVESTVGSFDLNRTIAFDDEEQQEYYIVCDGRALVHNYANNTWYVYDCFPALCLVKMEGTVYFGTADGRLMHLSSLYRNNDKEPIDAYWQSGAMDFGRDWVRKYSSTIWVSLKPESQAQLLVTAQSNLKSNYAKKLVATGLSSYINTSFAHWSFGTNRKPQVRRVKLKIKKFTYYALIFESKSASATATVLGVDIQLRYTGNVK